VKLQALIVHRGKEPGNQGCIVSFSVVAVGLEEPAGIQEWDIISFIGTNSRSRKSYITRGEVGGSDGGERET
jgi:hypothetical protein